ncbi:MAG: tRNA/rRNA methyltransferase (SpoU) [Firmicutes bacterium]|nr:tRNA/rRNA methyltransferase (SpoU) [Bacillota bacterium]
MTSILINSPQNKWIKTAAGLKQKKHRDEMGLFIAEGVRLCEELVDEDWPVEICLFIQSAEKNPRVKVLLKALEAKRTTLLEVSSSVLEKVAETEEPQGIVMIAHQRKPSLDELVSVSTPFLVVLDRVRDPGNAGTIIRTADAAGCSGVILLEGCVDVYSGKTIRATMGSAFHIPIATNIAPSHLLEAIKKYDINLVVSALDAAQPYDHSSLAGAAAFVFGNESHGVSNLLVQAAASKIFIPIWGGAESLNVASAAAVILYEAARQRRV